MSKSFIRYNSFVINLEDENRWAPVFQDSKYIEALKKASWIPFYIFCVLSTLSFGLCYLSFFSPAPLFLRFIFAPFATVFGCLFICFRLGRFLSFYGFYFGNPRYKKEIAYLADQTGVEGSLLLFMQFCYEWMSACTAVGLSIEGAPVMFRTMDWKLPILKKLTILLEVRKDGKPLYRAVTWVGCVSIYTAIAYPPDERHPPWIVAMNCRKTNPLYLPRNLLRLVMGKSSPGYAIRHALDSGMSYEEVLAFFTRQDYISPSFMTFVGARRPLTRPSTDYCPHVSVMAHLANFGEETFRMRSSYLDAPDQCLLQTNHDWWDEPHKVSWWQNFTKSVPRKQKVLSLMRSFTSVTDLMDTLLVEPVHRPDTIYASVLVADRNVYEPLIQIPK